MIRSRLRPYLRSGLSFALLLLCFFTHAADPKRVPGDAHTVDQRPAQQQAADTPLVAARQWISLFDGVSLNGWKRHGDSRPLYTVEDGCIVGTSVAKTRNAFLCTEQFFGDFVLELEFKVDPKLNSGVQIRSNVTAKNRVYGYQVEIDPSERSWSAGIYDEGRRGWLNNLSQNEAARQAFRQNEWNHYRIEAIGNHLRTFINGVAAADLRDALTQTGFIALQVHGTQSKEAMQVRWRNIRLQNIGRHEWQPIFDRRTLQGWHKVGNGTWSVQAGILKGVGAAAAPSSPGSPGSFLASDAQLKDFVAQVRFRIPAGNSGVCFRSHVSADGVSGLQAELARTSDVGGIVDTGQGWIVQPKSMSAQDLARCYDPDRFNDLTISAFGDEVIIHTNGRRTAQTDVDATSGSLALELNKGTQIDIERVELLLPAADAAAQLRAACTPAPGSALPAGAVSLLDPSLSAWTGKGKEKWRIGADDEGATLQITPGSGSIETAAHYRDFVLHVEFCLPEVESSDDHNGNSGIYLQRRYEIQILDSAGTRDDDSRDDGSRDDAARVDGCGAIYRYRAATQNAARPRGAWQSYDILFRSPRWRASGEKCGNARITVIHNGELIHNDVEVSRKTGMGDEEGSTAGPIKLQDHGSAVRFRNLWLLEL